MASYAFIVAIDVAFPKINSGGDPNITLAFVVPQMIKKSKQTLVAIAQGYSEK